jgi:hypothetical protein
MLRDIAEAVRPDGLDLLIANGDAEWLPRLERAKCCGDVATVADKDERSKAIHDPDDGVQLITLHFKWKCGCGDEERFFERAAEITERNASGNVRGDRSEEVTAVEGVAAARSPPTFIIKDHHRGNATERLGGGEEESVVWANQHIAASATDRDRPALRPNARIHDRHMCANRKMHE